MWNYSLRAKDHFVCRIFLRRYYCTVSVWIKFLSWNQSKGLFSFYIQKQGSIFFLHTEARVYILFTYRSKDLYSFYIQKQGSIFFLHTEARVYILFTYRGTHFVLDYEKTYFGQKKDNSVFQSDICYPCRLSLAVQMSAVIDRLLILNRYVSCHCLWNWSICSLMKMSAW